jgi:hypothetical protein
MVVADLGTAPEYEQVGDLIGCNYKNISVKYTALIGDVKRWPALFQDAFCAKLAAEMSIALTVADVGERLFQMYQFSVSEAYRTGIIDAGLRLDNNITEASKNTKQMFTPTPIAAAAGSER